LGKQAVSKAREIIRQATPRELKQCGGKREEMQTKNTGIPKGKKKKEPIETIEF